MIKCTLNDYKYKSGNFKLKPSEWRNLKNICEISHSGITDDLLCRIDVKNIELSLQPETLKKLHMSFKMLRGNYL